MSIFKKAFFLKSAAKLSQLPEDEGYEIAFAGRSNAGKSSALNTLTEQKGLAKTSKTPGRTQLINLFELDEHRRLVDLPGYGYAKVPHEVKERWQKTLAVFLEKRQCLRGVVVVADIRHTLKEMDQNMVNWALKSDLPCHILLTKSDKLAYGATKKAVLATQKLFAACNGQLSVSAFSSLKRDGLDILVNQLLAWLDIEI